MRRAVWFILVIAITLAVLILLWEFRGAIVLFGLSLVISAALRPLIHRFSSNRLSRRTALMMAYILLVGLIVLVLVLIGPALGRDLQNSTNDFAAGYERAMTQWPERGTTFQKMLAERLPPAEDIYRTVRGREGMVAMEAIFGAARNFFSILGSLALAIVLSLYWSADQFRFERLGLSLLPAEQHARALSAWRAMETGVGAFVRSETVQSLLALALLGAGYWAMGVRYPVLLALLGALTRLIPWFGVVFLMIPALLIGIGSPLQGLIYAAYTLAVLIGLRWYVGRRLYTPPHYSALPILLLIVILAEGYGLLGVLLAPILGRALQILLHELNPQPAGGFSPEVLDRTAHVMERLSDVQAKVAATAPEEPIPVLDRIQVLARRTRNFIRGY
jgi:predicted PurR-regulated permease PerM